MIKKNGIHTISIFVANKPGVLVRCAQVFARRAYNIDALVVSPGINPKYSRMTITASGDPETLDQIIKQTSKLVDVLHVMEHLGQDAVSREYAMFKIKCSSAGIKKSIKKLISHRAHMLDDSQGVLIIGCNGTTEQVDLMEDQLKKFGIIEIIRSGKLVMALGKEPT